MLASDGIRALLCTKLEPEKKLPSVNRKVSIVGSGRVGCACAVSCLLRGVTREVCLIDNDVERVEGEALDIRHGSPFLGGVRVTGTDDLSATAGSAVCVVTAGESQRPTETQKELLARNVGVFKNVIPQLVKYNPGATLVVVTDPVDLLTYVAWKLSGLPTSRVFGSGTNLDSARFRHLLSERLGVSVKDVHGWVVGEHGDTSVPLWSSVNVAGLPLRSLKPNLATEADPENWSEVHRAVVNAGYDVTRLKGHSSWAAGLSVAEIVEAVLGDRRTVHPVSTLVRGMYGVRREVFTSLPCVLAADGVVSVLNMKIDDDERDKFVYSCETIYEMQKDLRF